MTIKVSIKTEELSIARRILDENKIIGEIGENTENTFGQEIQGHFVQFNKKQDFNKFLGLLEKRTEEVRNR